MLTVAEGHITQGQLSQPPASQAVSFRAGKEHLLDLPFSFHFEARLFQQWKQMTFQNQKIKAVISHHIEWFPLSCVSQHPPSGWPRYSASEAVSPRSEKCLHGRTFFGLTDLAQGGDPGMAASEVKAASS